MSQPKLKALQALLESAAGADAALRAVRKENRTLRRAFARIAAIAAKVAAPVQSKRKGGRRPKIAAGSLEHRLVEAASEPVTLQQLVDASNARPADAKSAVVQLRKDGRLIRVGAGRSSKYQAAA